MQFSLPALQSVVACLAQGRFSNSIILLVGESLIWLASFRALFSFQRGCQYNQGFLQLHLIFPSHILQKTSNITSDLDNPFWQDEVHVDCLSLVNASASTGAAVQGFMLPYNLGRFGNGIALWLGIQPYGKLSWMALVIKFIFVLLASVFLHQSFKGIL